MCLSVCADTWPPFGLGLEADPLDIKQIVPHTDVEMACLFAIEQSRQAFAVWSLVEGQSKTSTVTPLCLQ